MPHGQHSSVALEGSALWLPQVCAVGDGQPCQLKVETQVGFFSLKDRQTIRGREEGTDKEKGMSDIGTR